MSFLYPATANLGAGKTGLTGTMGYRVHDISGVQITAFTTTNVVETAVPGSYRVNGGITVDVGYFVEWGIAGTKYAIEEIGPAQAAMATFAYTTPPSAAAVAVAVAAQVTTDHGPGSYVDAGGGGGDATEATSAKILKVVQAQQT